MLTAVLTAPCLREALSQRGRACRDVRFLWYSAENWLPPMVAVAQLGKTVCLLHVTYLCFLHGLLWQYFESCIHYFWLKKCHLWLHLHSLTKCLISADSEAHHQFTNASARTFHASWTEEPFVLFYLRILDISFNVLRHIEGLDQLTQLKKLFLVNNKISKIENLSNLQLLQMLELGSNRIRVGLLYEMLAGEFWALWLLGLACSQSALCWLWLVVLLFLLF